MTLQTRLMYSSHPYPKRPPVVKLYAVQKVKRQTRSPMDWWNWPAYRDKL